MGDENEIKRSGGVQNKRALRGAEDDTVSAIPEDGCCAVQFKHHYEVRLPKYEAADNIRDLRGIGNEPRGLFPLRPFCTGEYRRIRNIKIPPSNRRDFIVSNYPLIAACGAISKRGKSFAFSN